MRGIRRRRYSSCHSSHPWKWELSVLWRCGLEVYSTIRPNNQKNCQPSGEIELRLTEFETLTWEIPTIVPWKMSQRQVWAADTTKVSRKVWRCIEQSLSCCRRAGVGGRYLNFVANTWSHLCHVQKSGYDWGKWSSPPTYHKEDNFGARNRILTLQPWSGVNANSKVFRWPRYHHPNFLKTAPWKSNSCHKVIIRSWWIS